MNYRTDLAQRFADFLSREQTKRDEEDAQRLRVALANADYFKALYGDAPEESHRVNEA